MSARKTHDRDSFFKYTTVSTAQIVLATRKLRWSSPIIFNDLFDVPRELEVAFDRAEFDRAMSEERAALIESGRASSVANPVLARLGQYFDAASPEERRIMAQQMRTDPYPSRAPGNPLLEELRQVWSDSLPNFRTLCVSELNDVISMWLHYADAYHGVVLEFGCFDNPAVDSVFAGARPVQYGDGPPPLADLRAWIRSMLYGGQTLLDLLLETEYWKNTSWAYEREWRICCVKRPEESGLYSDWGFHNLELVGLYFGPKCSEDDRAMLRALLQHGLEHVQVYEAMPDNLNRKFSFRKI